MSKKVSQEEAEKEMRRFPGVSQPLLEFEDEREMMKKNVLLAIRPEENVSKVPPFRRKPAQAVCLSIGNDWVEKTGLVRPARVVFGWMFSDNGRIVGYIQMTPQYRYVLQSSSTNQYVKRRISRKEWRKYYSHLKLGDKERLEVLKYSRGFILWGCTGEVVKKLS